MSVSDKVKTVLSRISAAALRSGRSASDVQLVAVTKYFSADSDQVAEVLASGCVELGESRVQSIVEKAEFFASRKLGRELHWHLIGRLQRNKIRKVLPHVVLVHSVDSVKLAEAINRVAEEESIKQPVRCLLEAAVSGEKTKQGFEPETLEDAIEQIGKFENVQVVGLMCMSGLLSDDSKKRKEFATTRKIAERLKSNGLPTNCQMNELSMGMSDDFEIAIEEGATIVRVGRILYE
jgi:pyridoxal phosphate enzyme (YggS family)